MRVLSTSIALSALLLVGAAPPAPEPAGCGAPSDLSGPPSCSEDQPSAEQPSCVRDDGVVDTAGVLQRLRSMPDSFWDQVFEEPREESTFKPEPFGARPPSDPAEYAAALSKMLATPAPELFEFARYKGQLPVENMGSEAKFGQASVRMASMSIPDPIETVYKTYRSTLEAKGINAIGSPVSQNAYYFSFRASDGFMRTMTMVEMEADTLVVAAVGDPAKVQAPQGQGGFIADWPELPVEGNPIDLTQSEGAEVQLTRQMTLIATSSREAISLHKQKLVPLGWKIEPGTELSSGDFCGATFSRGSDRCTVTALPAQQGRIHVAAICTVRR